MQSGYGGVSEIQAQFMVDGCSPPSLFSISASTPPPPPNPNAATAAAAIQHHHQQNLYHFHHHQQQHHPPPPPHFSHLIHPIPITQQLFHHPHPHPHQFQLFLQHHQLHSLQEDHDTSPEASDSPAAPPPRPSFLAPAAMSFKLGSALNDVSSADGILPGNHDVVDGSESRLHSWHREEEESAATIKQPFWRPLDIDYINRNNKRPKSPEKTTNYSKKSCKEALVFIEHTANAAAASPVPANAAATGGNYKLFSELEAIYKPGRSGGGGSCGGGGSTMPNNNQTGSGSALTGDDNPFLPECAPCPAAIDDSLPDYGSDSSHGGDAPAVPPSQKGSSGSSGKRKQRAKRRQQEQMSMVTAFFESLVKQVMDHQESLHCKFLQVMERRDQERAGLEEAWRKQEAARSVSKAASRAQERALAASREAAIVSFLEKITGESLNLPQFPVDVDETHKDQECNALELYNVGGSGGSNNSTVQLNSTSRWPKAEVQALIRVRSGLETKFQEPGLKGPLWEEVSSTMAAVGYHRSAKRCKEKWENINKYFRKTKDSGKKRPQHSKTCPYFHQLDQLYAKSSPPPPSSSNVGISNDERKDNSELLDAIVVTNDHQSYRFPDIGNEDIAINEAGSSGMAGKSRGNYEEDDDNDNDNEDGIDGEEGEGDSQEHGHAQETINGHDHHHHLHQGQEDPQHDSTFFFQRLRS